MEGEKQIVVVKSDEGKLPLTKVPSKIIWEIAKVRAFGYSKYGPGADKWDEIEIERWRDALYRHWLAYLEDPKSVDEESGLTHLAHIACNVAFLCELESRI